MFAPNVKLNLNMRVRNAKRVSAPMLRHAPIVALNSNPAPSTYPAFYPSLLDYLFLSEAHGLFAGPYFTRRLPLFNQP